MYKGILLNIKGFLNNELIRLQNLALNVNGYIIKGSNLYETIQSLNCENVHLQFLFKNEKLIRINLIFPTIIILLKLCGCW